MADAKLTALTGVSVPAVADLLYLVDVSDTTDDAAGSSRSVTVERLLGLLTSQVGGRLTTESGVTVSTSDRTSQGTIYYTPHLHDRIALYDGTRWKLYAFTERSLALSGLTSGKNYDVFLYDNAGTLTLELSAAWTNDTTRADALTTQDGVLVKSGSTTRRYIGTIRTTGTTTTEDSRAKRFVWNHYNRVRRSMLVLETADSWSYGTASWRQGNNSTANQLAVVAGQAGDLLDVMVVTYATNQSGVAVGEDSTSTPHADSVGHYEGVSTGQQSARLAAPVPLGYHYYAWLEYAQSGTITWYGDAGFSAPTLRSGIMGVWTC